MLRALLALWLILVVFVPNLYTPFVLAGLLDANVPAQLFVGTTGTIVVVGSLVLVEFEVVRYAREAVSRRQAASIILGGLVSASWLGSFSLSPYAFLDALRTVQAYIGNGAAFALATGAWRFACESRSVAAHLLYYTLVSCVLTMFASSLVDFVERSDVMATVLATRMCTEELRYACAPLGWLSSSLWWFFGLSYDRLRVAVALATIALVHLRYALTDRQHHVPTSPIRLALILRAVLMSLVELVPVAPLLALRTAAGLLLGRPFLDTLHAQGLPAVLRAPATFVRAVSLRRACSRARSSDEWRTHRTTLELLEGRGEWREAEHSPYYDVPLVRRACATLRRVRAEAEAAGDPRELSQLLLSLVNRGFGNIGNPHNYAHPAHGAPAPIEELLFAVSDAIGLVAQREWTGRGVHFGAAQKVAFVEAATHAHGRAALCLSGGGAIALYHLGLVQELLEHDLMPSIISGTSGGSLVAGMLAVRTDAEMASFLRGEVEGVVAANRWLDPWHVMLRRLSREGVMVDKGKFLDAMVALAGDLTFAEAFARTGRLVNLSTSTPSLGSTLLLNHIITPSVLVRSAVQCSCAVPGVMRAGRLLAKAADGSIVPFESAGVMFRDGSMQNDIPLRELASQFHATHFIVSQCNPHLIPFLDDPVQPSSPAYRLQRYLVNDVRARLEKFDKKDKMAGTSLYLPSEVASLLNTYTGEESDVLIFPSPRLSDLTWRILSMPSVRDVRIFMDRGRAMTWRHLRRVSLQGEVERSLRRAAATLAGRGTAEPSPQRAARRDLFAGALPPRQSLSPSSSSSSLLLDGEAAAAGGASPRTCRTTSVDAYAARATPRHRRATPVPPPLPWVPAALDDDRRRSSRGGRRGSGGGGGGGGGDGGGGGGGGAAGGGAGGGARGGAGGGGPHASRTSRSSSAEARTPRGARPARPAAPVLASLLSACDEALRDAAVALQKKERWHVAPAPPSATRLAGAPPPLWVPGSHSRATPAPAPALAPVPAPTPSPTATTCRTGTTHRQVAGPAAQSTASTGRSNYRNRTTSWLGF